MNLDRQQSIKLFCLIIGALQSGHCRLQSCQTSFGRCHLTKHNKEALIENPVNQGDSNLSP